ncbi:MAG: endolytic transglycosylase MltG [Lachnospiraceae bacterium]|nr:endolytic transglycosylase MltG [Lachnospiraceae bacterium]
MLKDKESVTSIIFFMSIRTLINAALLLVLVEGFVLSYRFSYKVFADIPYIAASADMKSITIEPGTEVKDIAALLDDFGIVEGKYQFLARVYLGKYDDRIVAGTYTLGPGMTPDEICRRICGLQSGDAS